MKIRRKYLNDVAGNPRKQKALGAALSLKRALGKKSEIKNWNPNKIKDIINISPNSFKKYLPMMLEAGYVRIRGNNLVICKLHSDTDDRNVSVDFFDFGNGKVSFMEVYRSLRTFLAMFMQHKKDYICRTIQSCANPKGGDDYKSLRRKVKRLVKGGVLKSAQDVYREFGMSYRRIAEQTGNCVKTAQGIIKYGIKHNWINKQVNIIRDRIPGVNGRYVYGYDFTTKNYGYILRANTYTLSDEIELSFDVGSAKKKRCRHGISISW